MDKTETMEVIGVSTRRSHAGVLWGEGLATHLDFLPICTPFRAAIVRCLPPDIGKRQHCVLFGKIPNYERVCSM